MKNKSNWFWLAIIGGVLAVCLVLVVGRLSGAGLPLPTLTPTPTAQESLDPTASVDPEETGAPTEIVGPIAAVFIGDYVMDVVDLGTVTETYTKTYTGPTGETNTVEYKPGDVRVIEATCPDHVCIGQGWLIENMGSILPIACLPNSLMISMIPLDPVESPAVDGATQ